MLFTVLVPDPSDSAIDAAVEQRIANPTGPDTQRIVFAEQLAWIAEEGLTSFKAQDADLTCRFSFSDRREAVLFRLRWNVWASLGDPPA